MQQIKTRWPWLLLVLAGLGGMAFRLHAQELPKLVLPAGDKEIGPELPLEKGPSPRPLGPADLERLPALGAPVAGLPVPSPEVKERQKKHIHELVDSQDVLDLVVGRGKILVLKNAPRMVQIVDEKTAGVEVVGPTQLSLLGKKEGVTSLNLWFTDPKDAGAKQEILSYLVRVSRDPEAARTKERSYKVLEAEINRTFPHSQVHLCLVGDQIVVSGQAKDIADAAQILRVVSANAPNVTPEGVVRETTTVGVGVEATPLGNPVLAAGAAQTTETLRTIAGSNVVNLLRIPGEQQVMLRVTVAEVNRTALRSIGMNFQINSSQGLVFANRTGGLLADVQNAGGLVNLPAVLDNGQILLAINALRNLNLAKSLAEPVLTTMNGQSASFQAGGQFPVPVVTGFTASGLQGVSFIPFGVQLNFTPIVTDRDRIRLNLGAEVSTRDTSTGTNIGGAAVPGLNTRNFQTTVELREGQTLAVAGLIQTNYGATATRVPLLGDLPILGRLASYHTASAGEQELVILITPELVHPCERDKLPPLPGSDLFEPGDLEFYLLGRLESRRTQDYRSSVRTDIHRMLRYRRCDDLFIGGPHGFSEAP